MNLITLQKNTRAVRPMCSRFFFPNLKEISEVTRWNFRFVTVTPGLIDEPWGIPSLLTLYSFFSPHECVLWSTPANHLNKQSNTNQDANNHIQNDDWLLITNFPIISGRSDDIRLENVPWIVPFESYNL